MTKLSWHDEGQNRYEYGVDRGVFYPPDESGVVWNGLIKVAESSEGGDGASYSYDGIKYLDTVNPSAYQVTVSAYSTPSQFRAAEGERSVLPGFILTRQARQRFGLSYRTFVGPELGYKIHIIYNALASPTSRPHVTIAKNVKPATLSWKVVAVPPVREGYRPSAHYILDSMTMPPDALQILEDILYGSEDLPPRLPDPDELENIAIQLKPLYIQPQPTSGLSVLAPGMGDLYQTDLEGLNRALPHTRLYPSPIYGLYRLE